LTLSFIGKWEQALHTEVENTCAEISSDSTMIHLKDSQVLLSTGGCYGLQDNATVQALVDMATSDEGDDTRTRKKKDKKQVLHLFDV